MRLCLIAILNLAPLLSRASGESLELSKGRFQTAMSITQSTLDDLAEQKCISSRQVNGLLNKIKLQTGAVRTFTLEQTSSLELKLEAPMELSGSGICEGSFGSMVREFETRRTRVASTRKQLARATQLQGELFKAIYGIPQFDSPNPNCVRRAFQGLKQATNAVLDGFSALEEIEQTLALHEEKFARQNEVHRQRLAGCAPGGPETRAAAQTVTKGSGTVRRMPASISPKPASSITGIREDQRKRMQGKP